MGLMTWTVIAEGVVGMIIAFSSIFVGSPAFLFMLFSGLTLVTSGAAYLLFATFAIIAAERGRYYVAGALGAVFWTGALTFWGIFVWLAVDLWPEPGAVYAVVAGSTFAGVVAMTVALWMEKPIAFSGNRPSINKVWLAEDA